MINREKIQSADNIGVPKGEKAKALREALQEEGDIELPMTELRDGKLSAKSQGQTYWLLRGIDIVRRIEEERIDVGVVGSDVLLDEDVLLRKAVTAQRIGDPVCRFSLLAEQGGIAAVETKLQSDPRYPGPPMEFPTANPAMLSRIAAARDLPVVPLGLEISGSVEAYASLTGLGRVADIVDTGNQARRNGLFEVYKLCDIYPELVMRPIDEAL
jgi:ATP phosphoribosyltransferase